MITLITSKRTSQKAVRYRGTVLVETAIVLILLLMLLLGTMGFGYLFLRAEQVTNAARHGARTAIRYGATEADVQNAVADCLDPVKLTYTGPTYGAGGINPALGQPVTVTVESSGLDILNLRNIPIFGTELFPNDFNASVTMAKEGP